MKTNKPIEEKDSLKLLWLLFIIVFIVWTIPFILNYGDKTRTFADGYNSVNTLFSGLAMCGVIFAIFLQKKELTLQRKELRDTRQEFEIQNETLKKQRFENTFFQLINLHHEIVNNLELNNKTEREVFVQFINDLKNRIYKDYFTHELIGNELMDGIRAIPTNFPLEIYEANLIEGYKKNFDEIYENILGHYFRNLYHIYKLVYTSDLIPDNDKKFYANIVTAQLSSKELIAIFYNSLIKGLGNPKFLFLVNEFGLLRNMNQKTILDERHLLIFENYINKLSNPFLK